MIKYLCSFALALSLCFIPKPQEATAVAPVVFPIVWIGGNTVAFTPAAVSAFNALVRVYGFSKVIRFINVLTNGQIELIFEDNTLKRVKAPSFVQALNFQGSIGANTVTRNSNNSYYSGSAAYGTGVAGPNYKHNDKSYDHTGASTNSTFYPEIALKGNRSVNLILQSDTATSEIFIDKIINNPLYQKYSGNLVTTKYQSIDTLTGRKTGKTFFRMEFPFRDAALCEVVMYTYCEPKYNTDLEYKAYFPLALKRTNETVDCACDIDGRLPK